MTKKDFQLIADGFELYLGDDELNETARKWITHVARDMESLLRQTNPRFDGQRFLTACGVKE